MGQKENDLIAMEPHLEAILTSADENVTEFRQSMIADKFGVNGDPTEQVDGVCAVGVEPKNVLALTEREKLRSERTRSDDPMHVDFLVEGGPNQRER